MTFLKSLSFLCAVFSLKVSAQLPAIFSFGDSTVDVGNNNFLDKVNFYKANFVPYGYKFVSSTGRFTDGRLVGDYIAKAMYISAAPPYLGYVKRGLRIKHGINFGSSGSRVYFTSSCINDTACIVMGTQLAQFATVYSKYSSLKLSKSLFFISNGANDYFDLFTLLASGRTVNVTETVTNIVTAIIQSVQSLYGLGARKFLVSEVPAIGCTPNSLALSRVSSSSPKCVSSINAIIQGHNAALAQALTQLSAALPGSYISIVKTFDYITKLVSNPSAYGFKRAFVACCGGGLFNGEVQCGRKNYTQCKKSSEYVFWDIQHPTQVVYKTIALGIIEGNSSFVTPRGIKDLAKL